MSSVSSLDCVVFFFFQAEDGIRDIGVTGVQTCALSDLTEFTAARDSRTAPRKNSWSFGRGRTDSSSTPPDSPLSARNSSERSEERRVGKECRSRWSAYH